MRACSHSERLNSPRLHPCDPARILDAEVAFVRARSHSGRANSPRCRPREPARILGAGMPFVRARSHSGRASSRSLYGRRGGFRASPIAFCAREFFSASKCQQSLVSRKSFFPYSIPLLQDAEKYLLALGRSGGSPSSTNVMCLDVRGRARWDWEGTKYHRKNKFPPQGGGGN